MKINALETAKREYDLAESRYVEALEAKGLVFAPRGEGEGERARLRAQLAARGATVRNAGASIVVGHLSPACVECTGENGSETFSTTFKCHRDCYFCFNKNLPEYQHFFDCGCPWEETLERCYAENPTLGCVGLTGGEPLLDLDASIALLSRARDLYPTAHMRMYTSGDLLTEEGAQRLRDVGLDEIRFSVKDDDTPEQQKRVLTAMRLAKQYIPSVMVEMPIIPSPGNEERMFALMQNFDEVGIDGINMLEFCFPFANWDEYAKRGFTLKNPPFEQMYDYGYSGGLAVAGSEELILRLMLRAMEAELKLGMHYCSLENKHRSEIRIKNERIAGQIPIMTFDTEDFFLKAAKVFGEDVHVALAALENAGCTEIRTDEDENSLAFPLEYVDVVSGVKRTDGTPVQPQICYYVYECSDDDAFLIDVALESFQNENTRLQTLGDGA